MDEALRKLKKQKFYKKIMRNKAWAILIAVLAVLDIFFFYPRMHVSASTESIAIRLDQKAENTGWILSNGRSFYYDKDGKQAKGSTEIDGKSYYFDERLGYMKTGLVTVDGTQRYYGSDGTMVTGSVTVGEDHYYFDQDGNMHTGWLEADGEKYYYGEDGRQYFGMQEVDGKKCYFSGDTGVYKDMSVDPDKPMVCLTWDDGPADYTGVILDALEKVGGRGTFFVVGERVQYYESTVLRAVNMGCEIANHTWQHKYLDTLSPDGIVDQLTRTNDAVETLTGIRPTLMRPTGGRVTDTVQSSVGMPMIYWSLDTEDWKTQNTQSTVDTILNNVQDGDIILMHDLYDATAKAVEQVIPELVNRGFQLVTVSEMVEARGASLENGIVYFSFGPQSGQQTDVQQ